jgi:hypothetical protein
MTTPKLILAAIAVAFTASVVTAGAVSKMNASYHACVYNRILETADQGISEAKITLIKMTCR